MQMKWTTKKLVNSENIMITMKWTTKKLAAALADASRLGHASSLTTSARHRRAIGRGAQAPLRFTGHSMKWRTKKLEEQAGVSRLQHACSSMA
jgi:hypothetical protein